MLEAAGSYPALLHCWNGGSRHSLEQQHTGQYIQTGSYCSIYSIIHIYIHITNHNYLYENYHIWGQEVLLRANSRSRMVAEIDPQRTLTSWRRRAHR